MKVSKKKETVLTNGLPKIIMKYDTYVKKLNSPIKKSFLAELA
jgi:hypothetical protein